MSLISFHRFLIAAAIVFCLGYGVWEINAAIDGGGASAFIVGTIFTVLGISLIVYLRHLRRFLGYGEDGPAPR